MMWNNIKTGLFVLGFILTCRTWYKYYKNTSREQQKKEGWNNYYGLLSLVFFVLFIDRLLNLFHI